jgi:hypothetical protein
VLRHLGTCVAEVDSVLKGLDHPALHRSDFPWDLSNAPVVIDRHIDKVADSQMRSHIGEVQSIFAQYVAPRLAELERSVIHNDANDQNVIVQRTTMVKPHVVGLIDFGDMVHSYTVSGLAIAVAYAMLDKPDPLMAATRVVEGYQAVRPLSDDELAVVFPMACARLAVSACMAAFQQRLRPDDPYLSVSQQPIQRTFHHLLDVHPRFAEATFRNACGLPPNPTAVAVGHWLLENQDVVSPIMPFDLRTVSPAILDLSPCNADLPVGRDCEDALGDLVAKAMSCSTIDVAIGRYDEVRLIYTDDAFGGCCPTDERFTWAWIFSSKPIRQCMRPLLASSMHSPIEPMHRTMDQRSCYATKLMTLSSTRCTAISVANRYRRSNLGSPSKTDSPLPPLALVQRTAVGTHICTCR